MSTLAFLALSSGVVLAAVSVLLLGVSVANTLATLRLLERRIERLEKAGK